MKKKTEEVTEWRRKFELSERQWDGRKGGRVLVWISKERSENLILGWA